MSQDQRRRLLAAVQSHAQPSLRGGSLWIGHPGVKLRAADGTITEAGRRYEAMVQERGGGRPYEHAGYAPREARIEYRDGTELIEDREGVMRATRRWDASMNDGRGDWRFTPYGRRVDHNALRYVVEVPTIVRFWRRRIMADGRMVGEWSQPYRQNRMDTPYTVPITSDRIGPIVTPGNLNVVRNVGDHERQKQFIADGVQRYLLTQPAFNADELVLHDFTQSDAMYTVHVEDIGQWRNYTFSTEVVSHRADGAPTVETILNRPLRGEHRLPTEFLWKLGLVSGATRSFDGKCCAHQLVQAVQKRDRTGRADRRNAQDVFSLEDVEAILDDLQFELYPGHYHVAPPPVVLEATKRELEAYIPLWTGESNERRKCYIAPMRPRELHDLQEVVTKGNLTQRSELPPLAGVLKRHGMTLEAFFRLFPERFRIYGGRVVLWTVEEDDDVLEQRGLPPDEPYAMEGWRKVGVTSPLSI